VSHPGSDLGDGRDPSPADPSELGTKFTRFVGLNQETPPDTNHLGYFGDAGADAG